MNTPSVQAADVVRSSVQSTDVAIIGAGPVGLMIANILGLQGVRVTVIEKLDQIIDYPRAIGLDDEALRVFQSVGLAPSIRFRSTSAETCRALVARGLAYTVLNARPPGRGSDAQVVAVDIAHPAPALDVVLIKAAGVRPTRRMAAVQDMLDELRADGSIESMFGAG